VSIVYLWTEFNDNIDI